MNRLALARTVLASSLFALLIPTAVRAADAEVPAPKSDKAEAEAVDPEADACIDENVKADLFAKRKRRDVRDRLFQQTNRH